jgi:hypothetical protein
LFSFAAVNNTKEEAMRQKEYGVDGVIADRNLQSSVTNVREAYAKHSNKT